VYGGWVKLNVERHLFGYSVLVRECGRV
jgi:hypothetical protein